MTSNSLLTLATVAFLLAAGTLDAEPRQGQGQGQGQAAAQAQDQSRSQSQAKCPVEPRPEQAHTKEQKKMTHGQVVSECNHRANARKLSDKERKRFVEWCTDRGERYAFDDQRYRYDRDCYEQADRKDMSAMKRATFLAECTASHDRDYERDRDRDRDRDDQVPGRDVPQRNDQRQPD
jgi:hypothetical protein